MTKIGIRLSPELVCINGDPCKAVRARKRGTCAHSGKVIRSGDLVYRPINNSMRRTRRYIASEIEALEGTKKS